MIDQNDDKLTLTTTEALRFSITNSEPKFLIISGLVSINLKDGTLTYLEGYTPDKAACAFWQGLSEDYRKMLRWKTEHPEAA